jgi:bacterial/archaeal transporter family protein
MNNTLLSVLAGLGGMFGWGTSDFLANISSEKFGHTRTFFYSQIVGTILFGLLAIWKAASFGFSPFLVFLLLVSGVAYAAGYLLFYRGFEIGNVSVVSAIINLQNVFIVFIAFFLFNQRITSIQIPALMLLLVGATLVSVNVRDLKKGKLSLLLGVKETILAAILFGIFFWPVNQYIVRNSDWLAANFITKCIALITVLVISFLTKEKLSYPRESNGTSNLILLVSIGLLEALAILSVSGGLTIGNAIIINPVASALTLVTVGLALIFLKEKISLIQGVGILSTVVGIVVMSLGG